MGKSRLALYIGVSGLALALAGCEEGQSLGGGATASTERPSATRLVERDIEAPEVFQANEAGLWDGRPSLGGVWVAYPGVKDPERVIIRNEVNGQFVIGALFKRERDNPGPKMQVSSDAASALGLLAGQPTKLNVTALRREEEKVEAPAADPVEADTIAEAEDISEDALEPVTAAAESAEGVVEETVAEATETKKRWNPFRKKPAAATAATAAALTDPEAIDTASDDAAAIAAEATAALAATESVSVESIDAPATDAVDMASVQEPAKKERWNPFRRKKADQVITPEGAAVATAAAVSTSPEITSTAKPETIQTAALSSAPSKPASTVKKAYVQIGIFSVEGNAERTAAMMRNSGVVPTIYEQESSGKKYWRVVAGPAHNSLDRASLLKKVKSMGFADAYFVAK